MIRLERRRYLIDLYSEGCFLCHSPWFIRVRLLPYTFEWDLSSCPQHLLLFNLDLWCCHQVTVLPCVSVASNARTWPVFGRAIMLEILNNIEMIHIQMLVLRHWERSLRQLFTPACCDILGVTCPALLTLQIVGWQLLSVKLLRLNCLSWTWGKLRLGHRPKSSQSEASQKDNVFNLSNLKWFTAVLITDSHQNNLT